MSATRVLPNRAGMSRVRIPVCAAWPFFNPRSRPITPAAVRDRDVQRVIDAMIATMRYHGGVGLAAPQIGLALPIVVMEMTADHLGGVDPQTARRLGFAPFPLLVCINPALSIGHGAQSTAMARATETHTEACLSIPGYCARVQRYTAVLLQGLDRHGAPFAAPLTGWPARIAQHEVDHCCGVVYTDRMEPKSLATERNRPAHA